MSDNKSSSSQEHAFFAGRHYFVLLVILVLFSGLIGRATFLQVYNQEFLLDEGSQRQAG